MADDTVVYTDRKASDIMQVIGMIGGILNLWVCVSVATITCVFFITAKHFQIVIFENIC